MGACPQEIPFAQSAAGRRACAPLTFYVGVHQTRFLWHMNVPLMVSRRTLARQRPGQPARTRWALDSGGFTELSLFGEWRLAPADYVQQAQEWISVLGPPDFCAPQDWMCEPHMLRKTGLSVAEHQQRTVRNYLVLRSLAPEIPWMPVLQGWTLDDYRGCVQRYARAGVELAALDRVGIGTLCRRQSTEEAATIVRALSALGLRLHGFGLKRQGLARVAPFLCSADSHAWSFGYTGSPRDAHSGTGRYRARVPLCCDHYAYCANCWRYAQRWHGEVAASLAGPPERYAYQLALEWGEREQEGASERAAC